jgi:N-acetylmuramoyl-L-alanine amidase
MSPARRTHIALALCFGLAAAAFTSRSNEAAACDKETYTIIIDAGHTEEEPGATSARGVSEFVFNVNLARDVTAALAAAGFRKAEMLVTKGKGRAALYSRPAYANRKGAQLFLSIHHDSVQPQYLEPWTDSGTTQYFSDRFRGFSLFVSNLNAHKDQSLAFATLLGDELLSRGLSFTAHHAEDIKGERKPFLDPKRGIYRYDQLAVLRVASAPAVLLEAGVIVNRTEELDAASPERRNTIANAVVAAVTRFCRTQN